MEDKIIRIEEKEILDSVSIINLLSNNIKKFLLDFDNYPSVILLSDDLKITVENDSNRIVYRNSEYAKKSSNLQAIKYGGSDAILLCFMDFPSTTIELH